MITDRDIIIFNDDWGRYPSTLQHIANILLKNNNRVFWIGSLGLRKPKINLSDLKRALQKIIKVFFKSEKITKKSGIEPILVHPFVLPFHDFQFIRMINKFFITKKIKKTLKKYGSENPIIVTSAPISDFVIGELGETCSIYYCVDDYSSMEGAFKIIPSLEKKLIEKVDGIFAVSDFLYQTRKSNKKNIFLIQQGVELNHFHKIEQLADEVKNLKRPVIGFFGLISEWIDLDLIYKCTKKYSEYTFVIIGKTVLNLSHFDDCKNFVYLGPIEYRDLPKYASIFDVGIIPFQLNKVTIAANPLKLLEYFSLGIPVVSTNLPEVKKFDNLAYISENDDEFIRFIEIAVSDNLHERNQKRIYEAKKYSWESVTENIFDIVLKIESGKKIKQSVGLKV